MISDPHHDPESPASRREGATAFEGVATWLTFAAAPAFAAMALLAAVGGGMDGLCSTGSAPSPLTGMAGMYLLMSAFHLAPWFCLAARRR